MSKDSAGRLQINACMALKLGGARRCRVPCAVELAYRVLRKATPAAILRCCAQVCLLSAGLFQQKGFDITFIILVDSSCHEVLTVHAVTLPCLLVIP